MCSTFSQSFTEIIIFVDFLQHVNLLTGACSRNVIKKFGRLIRENNSFSWLWKKNRVPSTVRSTVIYFLKRKECTFFVSIETEYKYKKIQYRRNSARFKHRWILETVSAIAAWRSQIFQIDLFLQTKRIKLKLKLLKLSKKNKTCHEKNVVSTSKLCGFQ